MAEEQAPGMVTFRGYAQQAGFKDVDVLEQIPHDFLRFYRLTP